MCEVWQFNCCDLFPEIKDQTSSKACSSENWSKQKETINLISGGKTKINQLKSMCYVKLTPQVNNLRCGDINNIETILISWVKDKPWCWFCWTQWSNQIPFIQPHKDTFVQKHKMTVTAWDHADLNLYCCVQGPHKCQLACFGSNRIIIK